MPRKKKESKFDYQLLMNEVMGIKTEPGKEDIADEVELYLEQTEHTFNLKEIIELRDLLNIIIEEMNG